jgi:hypothetical protein
VGSSSMGWAQNLTDEAPYGVLGMEGMHNRRASDGLGRSEGNKQARMCNDLEVR